MMYIYDGRTSFYQWDLNQRITSRDFKVGEEIHFVNAQQSTALVVLVYEHEGKPVADVPNILLEKASPIIAYRYVHDSEASCTIDKQQFAVKPRPKPEGYFYTETELYTIKTAVDVAVQEALKDGGYVKPLIVTFTRNEPNGTSGTASHTATQIIEHILAGQAVYAYWIDALFAVSAFISDEGLETVYFSDSLLSRDHTNIENIIIEDGNKFEYSVMSVPSITKLNALEKRVKDLEDALKS